MSYPQHQNHNGSQQYYAPTQQSSYAYGNVSYALNHGGDAGNQASMESQKQGMEAIRSLVMVRLTLSIVTSSNQADSKYFAGYQSWYI